MSDAKQFIVGGVPVLVKDKVARESIGDLSELTTTNKSNLVEAINEAAQSGSGEGSDPEAVKYTSQSLDDSQKTQARTNIGAGTYSKPSSGIPASDLASGVIPDISGKQDTISDLSAIRSGAAAGSTSVQPTEFNELKDEVGTIGNGAYEEAWDGDSTPVVADIPAGVVVTYSSASYTGTLAASASTVDKIYLVSDGNGNYDRYTTVEANGAYSWKKVGSTAIPLSNYATKSEVSQLEAEVDDLNDKIGDTDYQVSRPTLTFTSGYINYVNGQKANSSVNSCSDAINVEGFEKIEYLSNTTTSSASTAAAAFYDGNGVHISSIAIDITDTQEEKIFTANVPTNAKTFRFTVRNDYLADAYVKLTKGKSIAEILNEGIADNSVTSSKIADGSVTREKLSSELQSIFGQTKNLFNPDDPDFETGKWLSEAGGKNTMSTAAISPFIPLTQEIGTLVASVNGVQMNYGGYGTCLYDANKHYVTGWQDGTKGYAEWQTGVAFARFTLLNYANGNIQIEQGTTPTSYVAYAVGIKGASVLPGTIDTAQIKNGAITEDKLSGTIATGGLVAYSSLGGESRVATIASLANDRLSITDYPRHLKRSGNISASANITAFDSIIVGVINGTDNYNALYAKVDSTNVYLCRRFPDERIISQEAHGMTISTFIKVAFQYRDNVAKVVVSTLADIKSFDFTDAYIDSYGLPVCIAGENSQFTDVVLRAGSSDMRKPIWVFGDSYVSFYSARWPYYLLPSRLDIDKYALFGLAGGNADELFPDVEKALMTNTPKFLVWALGMNDIDTSSAVNATWKSVWDSLTAICEAKGIILIGATIPNVPGRRMTFKNDIVRNSGYRYIDFAKAVNAEEAGASWYPGCLDSDEVHPTEAGAKVLCSQVLEDFPEIIDRDAIFD